MYGVAAYLKMVKKGASTSEILEFIEGLLFMPLKGGIGENQNKLRCQIKIVWHLLGMST